MKNKKASKKEILKIDFYDFVGGIASIFMTDEDKVKWYRENIESHG